jgi:hypothetical protein
VQLSALAGNRRCPPEILKQLADHPNINVRCQVAGNRSTPLDLLGRLLGDPRSTVAQAAADSPNLPRAVLAM